jgi:hypothetical protein
MADIALVFDGAAVVIGMVFPWHMAVYRTTSVNERFKFLYQLHLLKLAIYFENSLLIADGQSLLLQVFHQDYCNQGHTIP